MIALIDLDERFDPKKNVAAGSKYFNALLSRYENEELALAAYNWGSTNVMEVYRRSEEKWKKHLPGETRNFLMRVQSREKTLE